ncbi:serine hydrolase [Catenovulum sp. SM1970]|uniref:serine hydrolase domain-containing protein n=1 Tax=Marinifaba aquimaris TaxID=2741323 RepID=UPI00157415B4|nr:serine hydrolase [Marinifaba aquimaris]NTS76118.1 serine hydrolase [Marinifaba aquimaris]
MDRLNTTKADNAQQTNKYITSHHGNIISLIANKKGKTIVSYQPHLAHHNIHVASVTKSVVSILVGIALKKGQIKSIEDKVLDYFPDYRLKRGEKILPSVKIKDILSMTAPYKFKYEPYTKVYSSHDWTKSCLDLLGGKQNLGVFKYTTVGLHLLSGLMRNACGHPLINFANQHLFQPLGIAAKTKIAITDKASYFNLVKAKQVNGWACDPVGDVSTGWGLAINANDLLKLGLLYLNKGRWHNEQIVDESWIQLSTSTHSTSSYADYGYLWWVIDKSKGCYAALGDSGNALYINQSDELVVSVTSSFKPRADNRLSLIKNLTELNLS